MMFSFFKQEHILLQKMLHIDISHCVLWLLFVWIVLICGSVVVMDFFNSQHHPLFYYNVNLAACKWAESNLMKATVFDI